MPKDTLSPSELSEVFSRLANADKETLRNVRLEIARMERELGGGRNLRQPAKQLQSLGAVNLGATFVYRTVDILGTEPGPNTKKAPFEGQIVTVIGFRPRYVNQILAQAASGSKILLPLAEVENALTNQHRKDSMELRGRI